MVGRLHRSRQRAGRYTVGTALQRSAVSSDSSQGVRIMSCRILVRRRPRMSRAAAQPRLWTVTERCERLRTRRQPRPQLRPGRPSAPEPVASALTSLNGCTLQPPAVRTSNLAVLWPQSSRPLSSIHTAAPNPAGHVAGGSFRCAVLDYEMRRMRVSPHPALYSGASGRRERIR